LYRALIEDGKSKVDLPDKDGFTPLHRCCQESPMPKKEDQEEEGAAEVTSANKEAKAQENKLNDEKRGKIVKLLISNGANPKVKENNGHQTPLHLAAVNNYVQATK
jgi:ankyrin repeat protein